MDRIRIPGLFGTRKGSRLSEIEQGYLFRISRAVPLGLAGLASLVLLGGALVLLFTLIPPRKVREPVPAAIPPEVTVSLTQVQSHIASDNAGEADEATYDEEVETAPVAARTEPAWLALAGKVHAIRTLFPAPAYSWVDRYETYCADAYLDYCFRTDQRLVARGVASLVYSSVEMYDTGRQTEWVTLPDVKEGYQLNVTDAARKVTALTELEGILRQVPAGQRREVLSGWISVRQARESERLAQITRENQRVASERGAEQARYAAAQLKRTTLRGLSFSGIVGAIGALWMLGLTLALLAIERNTRQSRTLTREAPPVHAQAAGPGAHAPSLETA
jgi:hypothetical protein